MPIVLHPGSVHLIPRATTNRSRCDDRTTDTTVASDCCAIGWRFPLPDAAQPFCIFLTREVPSAESADENIGSAPSAFRFPPCSRDRPLNGGPDRKSCCRLLQRLRRDTDK